jgi:hypothetical protein
MVMDRLTKYLHFCGLQSTYMESQVVEVFMKEIHRLLRCTKVIVSDKDPKFIVHFLK